MLFVLQPRIVRSTLLLATWVRLAKTRRDKVCLTPQTAFGSSGSFRQNDVASRCRAVGFVLPNRLTACDPLGSFCQIYTGPRHASPLRAGTCLGFVWPKMAARRVAHWACPGLVDS